MRFKFEPGTTLSINGDNSKLVVSTVPLANLKHAALGESCFVLIIKMHNDNWN